VVFGEHTGRIERSASNPLTPLHQLRWPRRRCCPELLVMRSSWRSFTRSRWFSTSPGRPV